jgi:uncharacterized membrane protein
MEALPQANVLLIILGIIILVIVITLIFRSIKSLTTMQGYSCNNNAMRSGSCDVSRIPRGTRFRLVSPIIPLKRYACHDCGRKFIRFQPLFKDKDKD